MMRLLNYYYLVLLRIAVGKLEYNAPAIMALTFIMNLTSIGFAVWYKYIDWEYIFLGSAAIGMIAYIVMCFIYSTKRTRRIKEKYEDESDESRRRGAAWVITYEILSVVIFIWVIAATVKPQA